jgi:hypothetical protein
VAKPGSLGVVMNCTCDRSGRYPSLAANPNEHWTNCPDAPAKTPGQVGYEAMLELLKRGREPNPEVDQYSDPWEMQCDKLKADWEHVAKAILRAFT